MDELSDSEELAELESLLYSQIHHVCDAEPNAKEITSNVTSSVQNIFVSQRYFGEESSNKSYLTNNTELNNETITPDGNQSKDFQLYPNFSTSLPQTIHLSSNQPIQFPVTHVFPPAVNNIVFMTPNAQLNNPSLSKRQRKKIKQKVQQQLFQNATNDAEVFRCLSREDRLKVLKMQKRKNYLLKKKERKKWQNEQKLIEKYNNQELIYNNFLSQENTETNKEETNKVMGKIVPNKIKCEVIELSESDEEAIIAIEPKIDTVVLSSDDEERRPQMNTPKTVEEDENSIQILDIIAAEPITLDEKVEHQSQGKTDAELMKPPSDAETTSISSASMLSSEKTHTPKSQRIALNNSQDFVNTPESSNDFLDNTLDVSEKNNFNFGFHGTDLGSQKQFLKHRSLAEIYETESSCSASDASSLKNPVFNELEFDSPSKQLFSDANLESFGDYITPKRKSAGIPSILTANVEEEVFEQVRTKATSRRSEKSDSDTSSESEYGDKPKSTEKISRKKLPNLSHFDVEHVQAKNTPKPKNSKKKNLSKNKFDFIVSIEEESETIQVLETDKEIDVSKNKDSKKAKKLKQNVSDSNQDCHDDHNQVEQIISESSKGGKSTLKKRKKQSSKSDTELEQCSKERETKRKLATKSDSELEDNVSVNKSSKKKTKHKSDSEPDQNKETGTQVNHDLDINDLVEANCSGLADMSKRRKRKTKRDSKTEDISPSPSELDNEKKRKANTSENDKSEKAVLLSSDAPNIDDCEKSGKSNSIDEKGDGYYVFNNISDDDVEVIENSLPICIDLDNYMSNDDDAISLHNSWEVQPELNTSIIYETPASTSTADESQLEIIGDSEERSWCKSGFDSDRALKSMSSDSTKWRIMERDRIHIKLSQHAPRCKKCREIGHYAYQCNRDLRCWLCGGIGHQEPRCPNTVCTRCGRKTQFFTTRCGRCADLVYYDCKTCGSKGHSESLCPDFWRRYHLTTEVGPVKQVPVNLKPATERWCSGCAKQGHLEHCCNYYNRTHIPTKPYILQYDDVYKMSSKSKKSEPLQSPNKDPYEEDTPAVEHKRIEVKLKINKEVNDILQSAKGVQLLKELECSLYFTHSFEKNGDTCFLKIEAHPTDVIKLKNLFSTFFDSPTINYRKIHLTNNDLITLDSDEGRELITSLSAVNISHRMETKLAVKAIYLYGDALDILLAQYKLETFLANPDKQNVIIKTIDSKKGQKRIQALIKVRPYILQEIKSHPALESYMESQSIKCSDSNIHLILEGPSQNVRKMVYNFVSIKKGLKCTTSRMLTRIMRLTDQSSSSHQTVENLNKLLHQREYVSLNFLILSMEKGKNIFAELIHLRDIFLTNPLCIREDAKQFKKLLRILEKPKKRRYYTNAIKKLANINQKIDNETETIVNAATNNDIVPMQVNTGLQNDDEYVLNLYNFGNPSEERSNVFYVYIQPHHARHLLHTDEGNDFLGELNTQISLEVKLEESSLCLYCDEKQKEEIMKKINFYFQILEFEFPKTPSAIYRNLTTRLSRVALEYYLTNCKDLYHEIYNTGNVNPIMFAKLHSLLFAKYEFLDGFKHVETIKYYLGILSKMSDKETLNRTEFRKLKTAAMFLFCPFPLDIDYKLIISLAIPPTVPEFVTEANYTDSVNNIKSKMKFARQASALSKDVIKVFEIKTFQNYLYSRNFARDAIHRTSAFLNENAIQKA